MFSTPLNISIYNLIDYIEYIEKISRIISTSSANSGPLFMKLPSLVIETLVLVSNVMASFVSVFLNMICGIHTLSI